MVTNEPIQHPADDIVRRFAPERVILFGSYAYGLPTADSDVDVLVVLPPFDEPSAKKSSQMRQAIHAGFPLDVLAYSSEVLKKRLAMNDYFLREIVEKGKTLYDAADRTAIPATPQVVTKPEKLSSFACRFVRSHGRN